MKKFLLLFPLLLSLAGRSQNLVPNPSFEDTVACPTGGGQISYATGWSSYRGTPDYCNSCNTAFAGIPSNQWGYQYPRTGNAYAGVICYYTPAPNIREYMGIQLSQPLIIGQEYYVTFYAVMAFRPQAQSIGVASNKIGMRFTTGSYSSSNPIVTDNYAHMFSNSINSDTLNWIQISGSFVADSAYQYLSIGNFFVDSLTSTIFVDSASWYSYYYIDDVCVTSSVESCDSVVDIPEVSNDHLMEVLPNPASTWIEIRGSKIQTVEIYDSFGRIVYTANPSPSSLLQISISSFSKGVYFLRAQMKNITETKKIIIH